LLLSVATAENVVQNTIDIFAFYNYTRGGFALFLAAVEHAQYQSFLLSKIKS
jgi:hypothetical protein